MPICSIHGQFYAEECTWCAAKRGSSIEECTSEELMEAFHDEFLRVCGWEDPEAEDLEDEE